MNTLLEEQEKISTEELIERLKDFFGNLRGVIAWHLTV